MTNIDDSTHENTQDGPDTAPGYWFGEIDGRLREQLRDALADHGLRRGGWRILHTLADGPATAEELADALPHRRPDRDRRRGWHERHDGHGQHPHRPDVNHADAADRHFGPEHGFRPGFRPGFYPTEPRDEHTAENRPDAGFEHAFERGYERGFDRGFAFGAVRGTPYAHAGGRFAGAPFAGSPFPGGPFAGHHPRHPFGHRGGRPGRGHRIQHILSEFVERGWVWFDGDRATLTDEGRAAHDAAFERVKAVRSRVADGIPEEDYATTLATLEKMARNLGWTPARERDEHAPAEAGDPKGSPEGAPSMDA
jgi:hypothetical protein